MPNSFLIVGGSGFLGRALVNWVSKADDIEGAATFLDNPVQTQDDETDIVWERCDVMDLAELRRVVQLARPNVVINSAYRQSGEQAAEICSVGAENVAIAAVECGARLVHISTDLVFDGTLGRPYREDDPVHPIGAYGRAKAIAESLVLEAHHDSAIVRTSLIYGDRTAPQEQLVHRAIEDGEISFFTDEWRSPVEVEHLADAVGRLALSDHRGLIHIAGDERINRFEFARLLAHRHGWDAQALRGRTQDPALGPRASDVSLDTTLAGELGFAVPGPSTVMESASP